jgi:hypothetical protein
MWRRGNTMGCRFWVGRDPTDKKTQSQCLRCLRHPDVILTIWFWRRRSTTYRKHCRHQGYRRTNLFQTRSRMRLYISSQHHYEVPSLLFTFWMSEQESNSRREDNSDIFLCETTDRIGSANSKPDFGIELQSPCTMSYHKC